MSEQRDDGGHVFPQPKVWDASRAEYADTNQYPGMTLRDYFAAKAAAAYMNGAIVAGHSWSPAEIAVEAYLLADAMLAARKSA